MSVYGWLDTLAVRTISDGHEKSGFAEKAITLSR
jgi:hypothetical protein